MSWPRNHTPCVHPPCVGINYGLLSLKNYIMLNDEGAGRVVHYHRVSESVDEGPLKALREQCSVCHFLNRFNRSRIEEYYLNKANKQHILC